MNPLHLMQFPSYNSPMTAANEPNLHPGKSHLIISLGWIVLALAVTIPVTLALGGSYPVFTVLWLAVPLIALLRSRDPRCIGLRPVPWSLLLKTTALNLGALLLVMAAFEPWSHTYRLLIAAALAAPVPDTTFAWLLRLPGPAGWIGMAFYSGLVTLFGEELFFRGWLLQLLLRHMRPWLAIALQAALFSLPQALAALVMPPLQGALYVVVYSWLSIGVIGGWAAWRTQSIWPSLISATLCNLLLTALVN
jgi:membrane protease YdiL (CAAX protease family)